MERLPKSGPQARECINSCVKPATLLLSVSSQSKCIFLVKSCIICSLAISDVEYIIITIFTVYMWSNFHTNICGPIPQLGQKKVNLIHQTPSLPSDLKKGRNLASQTMSNVNLIEVTLLSHHWLTVTKFIHPQEKR